MSVCKQLFFGLPHTVTGLACNGDETDGSAASVGAGHAGTMRFGSTAKVLAECELKYYRILECAGSPWPHLERG